MNYKVYYFYEIPEECKAKPEYQVLLKYVQTKIDKGLDEDDYVVWVDENNNFRLWPNGCPACILFDYC